jgi:protein-disulfide isomerase
MMMRFLVTCLKRTLAFLLLICLGCSAQSPSDLNQKIERHLRFTYKLPPSVKVTISAPHSSDFPNYDALTVTFDDQGHKQNYDFLLSKDQKTLLRMTKMDLGQDPYAEVMKKIDVKGRPIRGNPNAKVVVVNYDDFQCPYCSHAHQTLFPQLFKEYSDRVAFIYKDFPLSEIHPWAIHAAVDANCLAAQSGDAYWSFADYIHAHRDVVNSEKGLDNQFAALDRITMTEAAKFKVETAPLQACVKGQDDRAVKASVKEAESLDVNGTPTMIINGQVVDGARPAEELRVLLDTALKQAGLSAPAHPSASSAADAGTGSSATAER